MTLRDDQLRALEAFADGRLDGNERGDAERLLSENPEAAAKLKAWVLAVTTLVKALTLLPKSTARILKS